MAISWGKYKVTHHPRDNNLFPIRLCRVSFCLPALEVKSWYQLHTFLPDWFVLISYPPHPKSFSPKLTGWPPCRGGEVKLATSLTLLLVSPMPSVELNFPATLYSSLTDEVRDFALPNLLEEVKDFTTLVRLLYWNTIYLASCVLVPLHSSKLPILTYPPSYDLTAFLRLVLSVHSLP